MDLSPRAVPISAVFLSLAVSTIPASLSLASTPIYTYLDETGVQHFTNQLESIPEQYRDQMRQSEAGAFSEPSVAAAGPAPAQSFSPAVLSVAPPVRSTGFRTVTADGEYRMGDHDTRTDAVRLAVEAAKKDALEQVATYLERVTEVIDMDVTRDDIRTYTAGIVKVVDQTITTRLEGEDSVVIRADLTAEVDPHEVAQAIAALRENESAKQELLALRAETDRLQEQLDAT
ncbi:MAG: exported protein of unknown function, partial [Nitrospira sp.]|nr:exported protein of unknown function [Nitrospira sp.]